jgi:hypothetical protein
MRASGGWWLAAVAAAALFGCSDTPERVGDRFMDRYFVEIDQARARPLTSGLATRKLDEELRLVESVRKSYSPDQAKPTVYYGRLGGETAVDHARASYEVRIKQGRDDTRRSVLLTFERTGGRWTVSNFTVEETQAPSRSGS